MNKITAVILTKNEEENIRRSLESVLWSNEVIVIDDYSTDGTAKIAKSLGARVYKHHLNNNFAAQRNFGLTKALNKWVLFIDADEEVTASLAQKIQKSVINTKNNGFLIRRRDIFLGKKLKGGENGNLYLLRLAKKKQGSWTRGVHEVWNIQGDIGKIKEPLLHYSHKNITQFVQQISFHSMLHAKEGRVEQKKSSMLKLVMFPFIKFAHNFGVRRAYKDATHGFVAAVFMSMHSFLSWSLLYLEE